MEKEKEMISVDDWKEGSQVYFLTHLHSDHTKGLSSNWKNGPLVCSPITAKLIPAKFPGFDLSLLKVFEIGPTYTLPLLSPFTGREIQVQVTLIDADHCPGAVMYLFRGDKFCCKLYTGDFRWEPTSERALLGKTRLLDALGNDKIDLLYLDNTYCNPLYSFPPREVIAKQIIDIIASHPEHDVVISVNTLGKEDLLVCISRALNIKIWVWPERLQTMHLLGFYDIFTTNTSLTRVRAVPSYSFSIDTLEKLNSRRPTIGILPSGLPWLVRGSDKNDYSCGSDKSNIAGQSAQAHKCNQVEGLSSCIKFDRFIYSLPYSDHSCFDELQEFIKLVQPLRLKGIVSSDSCNVDPRHYFGHLCKLDQVTEQPPKKLPRKVKPVVGCSKSGNLAIKRRKYMKFGSTRISRVSLLRRLRRGAKIIESFTAACSISDS
ncbi:5' exonuclease Apollo [Thalictrum thalictroides]|uniref:Protein artemis n=1 Tax=Thalictrum thalictroides TaxID=46969 RepID=A0A7J6XGZ3_THATH|nr:5' exonuclease Apollo [Thalictrum thalictroides]